MGFKSSAKVGFVVLLALALGIGLYMNLAHIRTNSYNVRLKVTDTQGLTAQSLVRMQGVAVGEVSSVDLDENNQPLIVLAIKRRYHIPRNFIFRITSGILITQAQVQIMAPLDKNGMPEPPESDFVATTGDAEVEG